MPERAPSGLLDTSVVVDLDVLEPSALPMQNAISAITLAELAAGPHVAAGPDERARRQDILQRAEVGFDVLPFDANAARAYGRVVAAVVASGRKARGGRALDLLLAAAALSAGLPLYTRNGEDFRGLDDLVTIIEV